MQTIFFLMKSKMLKKKNSPHWSSLPEIPAVGESAVNIRQPTV